MIVKPIGRDEHHYVKMDHLYIKKMN